MDHLPVELLPRKTGILMAAAGRLSRTSATVDPVG